MVSRWQNALPKKNSCGSVIKSPNESTYVSYYITTAIDYPNNLPHIGTAFEKIGADVLARFHRMNDDQVYFQIGNDENTIKVSQKAKQLDLTPPYYVDHMSGQFQKVWKSLNISYDNFIQTSSSAHYSGCRTFIDVVNKKGDIYKKLYKGFYCNGCEAFKTEKEIVNGHCIDHLDMTLHEVEEENYFFRLSKYQAQILQHYEWNPDFLQPESRRNEILNVIKDGLQDITISRLNFTWGIPVPFDPKHTIYVWFDALLNYITGIGYGTDQSNFKELWPADIHIIGKDITRFHCTLWLAMLMSADLPLPRKIFAHGFVCNKGVKYSKSKGDAPDPMTLVAKYGADAFRYYFMRECAFGSDGNFSTDRFIEVYNSDLANNLGNLYSRSIGMCLNYFNGELGILKENVPFWLSKEVMGALCDELSSGINQCKFSIVLHTIWHQVLDEANRYVDQTAPFHLSQTNKEECKVVLTNLVEAMRVIAILLKPFMPDTAEIFYNAFNFNNITPWEAVKYSDIAVKPTIALRTAPQKKTKPLFPRIRV